MMNALHFVGFVHPAEFVSGRYARAVQVFGKPDFVHRRWDIRAKAEVMEGDTVVFADGDEHSTPNVHAYDDSAVQ